ncbi:cell adhesion molecule Dscam2-like [Panulirus ornatus]|uniref:cell adhesion molecule Dscam2-like n=1 Tax=Panulirus ornatus TaxID=150431 RepID=UPI003A8509A6
MSETPDARARSARAAPPAAPTGLSGARAPCRPRGAPQEDLRAGMRRVYRPSRPARLLGVVLLLLLQEQAGGGAAEGRGVTQGPTFSQEPPRHLHFTNTTGATINCVAQGAPTPTITWTLHQGRQLQQVEGLREVLANGSLVFPPFPAHRYDTQLHAATYTCRASSPAGTILATPTLVRAVVVGDYEVQVYDQLVMAGNTAVLRCAVPSYVREYVTVTSWLHDNSFNIYPSLHGDGKYHMSSEGELHVLEVGPQDGLSRFQCRTLHQLTSRTQLSRTPARIIITEAQGSVPPRMSERAGRVVVQAGARVTLPCVAQGHPPPQYTWYRGSRPVMGGSGVWAVGGSLVLARVGVADAGQYTCVANNTAGETRFSAHLLVTLPLSVQVTPREVQVDAGGRLELRCHVSGEPVDTVTWYKDGNVLRSGRRVRLRPRESLHVAPVDASDAGIYQCTATYGQDYAHAHAHVTLGAAAPQLVYRFIEQTLQPGPAVSLKCIATGTPTPHISWTLDGFPIPHSHRYVKGQYVSAHGDVISHVNISTVHVTDGGTYTCWAENSAGRVVHSARLNVYGPPHVRPMGQVSAVAGQTFTVSCPASGYPIHRITWKKDGVRLPTSHRQRVHPNGTLVLEEVTRGADDGQYSCTASSRQGRSDTQHLSVRVMVPPRLAPLNFPVETRAGMQVRATCLVQEGDQPLTHAWQKDGHPLDPGLDVRTSQLDAFTSILVIDRATAAHSGNYTCAATNAARTSTTNALLTVSVPPAWVVEPASASVALGGTVALHCLAKGFPNPTVAWRKETASGEFVGVATGEGGVVGWENGTLSVSRAERRHEGRYLCEADNNVGAGLSKVVTLSVNEPPWFGVRSQRQQVKVGGRATLTCEAHGDDPLTLTWTRGTAPLPPIPRYEVSEREVETGRVSELLLRNTHLSDSGTYVCTASNTHGSLTADFHLLVQGTVHRRYTARYAGVPTPFSPYSEGEAGAYNFTTVGVDGAGVTTATLAGLRPHARYTVVLQAFNSRGAGPASPPALGTTLEDKPSAPPGHVTCDSVTSSNLVVTWSPPPPRYRNGLITSYRVAFSQAAAHDGGRSGSVVSEGLRATLAGLTPWTNYSVSVAASTRAGEGTPSHAIICTTDQDVPEAPARVKAVVSGPRAAVVSWAPPARPHGRISRYTVHWESSGGGRAGAQSRRVEPHVTHMTLHDLAHTTHQVWVTASSRMGEGPPSIVAVVKPSHTVPAGVWSVGGNLTVAWKEDVSLACGAVGVPEPSLTWAHQRRPIPASHGRFRVQPDGTLTLADIQRSDTGHYTCTATNHHGSDTATYNLTVLVPPSAPSLHVTETTASSIRVQWSVEDTGGAALQGATLHYRSAGGEWMTVEVDGSRRAYTATGLRCGTLHHFYLTAHNHIGSSAASSTEAARTKGRPPEAPPQFQFVTSNSSQATLYLAQWGDGGCPITHFSVQYRRASLTRWTTVGSEIPPSRTYAVGGLEAGGRYELRVTAHNAAGATPAHYTVSTPGVGISAGTGVGVGGSVWGSSPSTSPAWRDPRVLVPATVSALALLLTLATVCVCLRKRPTSRPQQKEVPDVVTASGEEKTAMQAREDVYTTVRRPAPTPPQQQQQDIRDNTGEYSEEDLYPYATATFQMGGGSPPPPAPPSPPTHAAHHQQQPRGQKGFTALVYQAPSLHDVDSPNLSEMESRPTPRVFPYDGSQAVASAAAAAAAAVEYGGVLGGPEAGGHSPAAHHRRPPRHLRTRPPGTLGSPKTRRPQPHRQFLQHQLQQQQQHYHLQQEEEEQQQQHYLQQQQQQQQHYLQQQQSTFRPACHPRQV